MELNWIAPMPVWIEGEMYNAEHVSLKQSEAGRCER